MADAGTLPLTVIRPSWLFGERDRTTVPRLIREFRRGRMLIVGKGDNPLSAVYAGVVADAAILAARDPGSRGEAYNITSHGRITQREFLDLFADALEVPRVTGTFPTRWPSRAVSCSSCRTGCSARSGLRGSRGTGPGSWAVISNTAPRKPELGWAGSPRSATARASNARSDGSWTERQTPGPFPIGPADRSAAPDQTESGESADVKLLGVAVDLVELGLAGPH